MEIASPKIFHSSQPDYVKGIYIGKSNATIIIIIIICNRILVDESSIF